MAHEFVHLQVHSYYTLLDGTASPRALVEHARRRGFKAMALTDRWAMHGAVQFQDACDAAGIHPIFGCELAFDGLPLTMLAADETGYRNLCRLMRQSEWGTVGERPPGVGSVDPTVLAEHRGGLIGLLGVERGWTPPQFDDAHRSITNTLTACQDILGPDNLYIALVDHGLAWQQEANQVLLEAARAANAPVVASNDVFYPEPGGAETRRVLHAIASGRSLQGGRGGSVDGQAFLKSGNAMHDVFGSIEGALTNTLRIAERCHANIRSVVSPMPRFPRQSHQSSEQFLRQLAEEGAAERYGTPLSDVVTERLEHELTTINTMGFADYFLIVWDIVTFARRQHIAVGPGRGSSASSLVAYVLGITAVDPLAHGLLFERFLNPDRITLPDIDIDLCYRRRGEVIDFLIERYGADRVAQIVTFGRLAARAAVRDVGRLLDVPKRDLDRLSQLIPSEPGITLAKAMQNRPALKKAFEINETNRRLLDLAVSVEGIPRHLSVHAAGIVMAEEQLAHHLPLMTAVDGTVLTQYPGEDLESLGYLKMDLLGLRTLTVIDNTVRAVAASPGQSLSWPDIPLDDDRVYAGLARGDTEGVFQLETDMFKTLLPQVKPVDFNDLIALLALGRPGPMARIDDYLALRHGRPGAPVVHPRLRSIVEETHGLMLYQEQVMQAAVDVAGYSLKDADLLRRTMAHADEEAMRQEKERFVAAARDLGCPPEEAAHIFNDLSHFAAYGFPKSHSAAYALLTYQTAYLKTHYPAWFMAAQLNSVGRAAPRIKRYIAECRRLGVPVHGPDINLSDALFTVTGNSIRYGLAAFKHVGHHVAVQIAAGRDAGAYTSIEDVLRRLSGGLNPWKSIESLVRAGAFDKVYGDRNKAIAAWENIATDDPQLRGRIAQGQTALFSSRADRSSVAPHADHPTAESHKYDTGPSFDGPKVDEILGPYADVFQSWTAPGTDAIGRPCTVGGVVFPGGQRDGRGRTVRVRDLHGTDVDVIAPSHAVGAVAPGDVVVVTGQVIVREGVAAIAADAVHAVRGEPLTVSIRAAADLQALQSWITQHPGCRPVIAILYGRRYRAALVFPAHHWVASDVEPVFNERMTERWK